MTSAYECIITTRSFQRTRIELSSAAWKLNFPAYSHCRTKYLNYSSIMRRILLNKKYRRNNKPRTAKVGVISKAQNCKRGDPSGFVNWREALWGLEKISRKNFKIEIFEQCHSAEKCKRGTLWDFFTSIVSKQMKGGPLVQSKKFQKKSHSAEKSGA